MSPNPYGGMPTITFQSPNHSQQIPLVGGMVVVLANGHGQDRSDTANPIWGKDGNYFRGTVRNINQSGSQIYVEVQWEYGARNAYCITDGTCELLPQEFASKPKSKWTTKLDASQLDALVIPADTKTEILAVLKQHQNREKLFKEWGLGETIEYGRGMSFMFYGPPGTGKTWGANCIAKMLQMELLIISAAEIQSSEPGGANRAIQNAFSTARDSNKVLFIDECDSLITQRNDVGMILSSEINTLLTEIEKSEGVTILATNRIETMDEALERRISLIVEFPFPNFEQRKEIWGKLIPKKMPLSEDVSLDDLAKEKLTGGQIKNVLLQAARLALGADAEKVSKANFDMAIARFKQSKGLMGQQSRYRQGRREDYSRSASGGVVKTKDAALDAVLDIDEDEEKEKGV